MEDLLSPDRIARVDPKRVYRTYEDWPSLARNGFGVRVELPSRKFRKAYVLGMGGSAAGGDIIAGWLSDRPGVEMAVFKGQLPIGDLSDAVAIACSASGQTEETIDMLRTAVKRKATVVSISGGGKLKEVSSDLGVQHIGMPEFVAPRYVFPFIFFSTLAIVNKGLDLDCDAEAQGTFRILEQEGRAIGVRSPPPDNPSKRLALSLYQKVPAIYAARVARGVGLRFKNILNENAKRHAFFGAIPDAFHNEIEAWEDPVDDFIPVFLRHSHESARDTVRLDAMVEMITKGGKEPIQVRGLGASSLDQLVSMVYRLDLTSYYVAIALGRDPLPTKFLDQLKSAT